MVFELNEFHRNATDSDLIDDLQRVAKILNQDTVTLDDYNHYGKFHSTTLTRRFGSWFTCLAKASLKPSRSKIGITDEELFEEIKKCMGSIRKAANILTNARHFQIFSRNIRKAFWWLA